MCCLGITTLYSVYLLEEKYPYYDAFLLCKSIEKYFVYIKTCIINSQKCTLIELLTAGGWEFSKSVLYFYLPE